MLHFCAAKLLLHLECVIDQISNKQEALVIRSVSFLINTKINSSIHFVMTSEDFFFPHLKTIHTLQ